MKYDVIKIKKINDKSDTLERKKNNLFNSIKEANEKYDLRTTLSIAGLHGAMMEGKIPNGDYVSSDFFLLRNEKINLEYSPVLYLGRGNVNPILENPIEAFRQIKQRKYYIPQTETEVAKVIDSNETLRLPFSELIHEDGKLVTYETFWGESSNGYILDFRIKKRHRLEDLPLKIGSWMFQSKTIFDKLISSGSNNDNGKNLYLPDPKSGLDSFYDREITVLPIVYSTGRYFAMPCMRSHNLNFIVKPKNQKENFWLSQALESITSDLDHTVKTMKAKDATMLAKLVALYLQRNS